MLRFYFSSYFEGEKVMDVLRPLMTTKADYEGWEDMTWNEGRLIKTSVRRTARLIRTISAEQGVQLTEGDDIPASTTWDMFFGDES